jgi:hypothetical protein
VCSEESKRTKVSQPRITVGSWSEGIKYLALVIWTAYTYRVLGICANGIGRDGEAESLGRNWSWDLRGTPGSIM